MNGISAPPGRGVDGHSRLTTETKAAFKTTEFWTYLVAVVAVLIAADNIGGRSDYFRADKAWLFVTVLTIGYLISRGLAKAGSREPYTDVQATGDSGGISERVQKAVAVLKDGDVHDGSTPPGRPAGSAAQSDNPAR